MAFMEWTGSFSVGVAVFDDEHKKLIALINRLHECASGGRDLPALKSICDELVDYTLQHFRHEEEYFDEWGYPGAKEHTARHEQLQRRVYAYRNRLQGAEGMELALEMLRFLSDWLQRHIMIEDRKYGQFLLQKGLHGL